MQADLPKFKAKNAEVIAVAVQDKTGAQATVQDSNVTYPVLADPDHSMTDSYNVFNLLNDNVATPAVFIIDTSGKIVWSYIGQHIQDRPSNVEILANLPPAS